MRRRGRRSHWAAVVGLAVLMVAGTTLVTGCSDEPEVDSCESHDDCDGDEICDLDQEVCVAPEAVDCEGDEDCPEGWICDEDDDEDAICVEAEGSECELTGDCPGDGQYVCEDGECTEDVIEEEQYDISFSAERDPPSPDQEASTRLMLSDEEGDIEEIDTGDIDCHDAQECRLTADGDHLIAVVDAGEDYDAVVADVSGDPPAVDGDAEVFAESIQRPRLRGDGVAFERIEDSHRVARFQHYDGEELEIAQLNDPDSQLEHSWDIHPESGRTMQFVPPDLNSLDIRVGTMDEPITGDDVLTRLDGSSAGDALGSFYLTSIPATASSDGRLVAFTASGLNDYGNCESHDDCEGTSRACGEIGRCFAIEETVYIVDTDYEDNLGNDCLGHDECGPIHRCDSGSEDFDGGQCQPQRIVVGLPETPSQPRGTEEESRSGCEATRDDETFGFTDVNPPLSFGPDGRVYFVGYRDCTRSEADPADDVEANIPRTSIVAADPVSGEHEELFGNVDREDYDARGCTEPGEWAEDMDQCNLVFDDVRFSPQYNDFVLRASNPAVSASLADQAMDVWNMHRDGDQLRWIGGLAGTEEAGDATVHGSDIEADDNGEDDNDGDDSDE